MDLRKQNSTYEERTPPEGSNISIFTSCSKIMLPVRKSAHMQYALFNLCSCKCVCIFNANDQVCRCTRSQAKPGVNLFGLQLEFDLLASLIYSYFATISLNEITFGFCPVRVLYLLTIDTCVQYNNSPLPIILISLD